MELSKLKPEVVDNEVKLVPDVDERPKGMARIILDDPVDEFPNEKEL